MRTIILLIFLLFFPLLLFAQPGELLESLLLEEEASFGSSAYVVLVSAELIPEDSSPAEAALFLHEQGWKKLDKNADDTIRLGEFSFMILKAFGWKGGIMYSVFPGPRYASRELTFQKIFRKREEPGRTLSGEEVLRYLGRVLEREE